MAEQTARTSNRKHEPRFAVRGTAAELLVVDIDEAEAWWLNFCDESEQSDKAKAAERVQYTKWKNVDKPDEKWSLRSKLSGDETSPDKRGRSSWREDKSWEQERSPSLAHWYQHMAVVQRLELLAQQIIRWDEVVDHEKSVELAEQEVLAFAYQCETRPFVMRSIE